jgi:hypothetical protein
MTKRRKTGPFSLEEQYGIDEEMRESLEQLSGNRCWICLKPESVLTQGGKKVRSLAIDHDHLTGQVRGLLCFTCNTGLGRFADNWATLQRAYLYLRRSWNQYCDCCQQCHKPARPKRLVKTTGLASTFAYECCGAEWQCGHLTKGAGGAALLDAFFACWVPPGLELDAEQQCLDPSHKPATKAQPAPRAAAQ